MAHEKWTTTLFAECPICEKLYNERRKYCKTCLKTIFEDLHRSIILKIKELKDLREENVHLSNNEVPSVVVQKEEYTRMKIAYQQKVIKISELKERMLYLQQQTKAAKATAMELKKRSMIRRDFFLVAKHQLEIYSDQLDKTQKAHVSSLELQEEKERLSKAVTEQRKLLVSHLLSFFPLNPISESECALVNIKLHNVYSFWEELLEPEVLATALGYLVHMLSVIATYLDMCLPYQMLFLGSRSLIWRQGSEKRYLLYNNHTDPTEFRVALEMVNWNVIHFCLSQGVDITVDRHEHTLPNLLRALRSPRFGILYKREGANVFTQPTTGFQTKASISSLSMPNIGKETPDDETDEFIMIDTIKPRQAEDTDRSMFIDTLDSFT